MPFRSSIIKPQVLVGATLLGLLLLPVGCSLQPPSSTTAPAATAIPQLRLVSSTERDQYAGSEACARCHEAQSRSHRDSHHAHTLTPVTVANNGDRFRRPSKVTDTVRDLSFQAGVQGERCVVTAKFEGKATSLHADFAVGSGKHAVTYLTAQEDQFQELRLTYYTKAARWDFSPGQQPTRMGGGVLFPTGLLKVPREAEECFVCHGTAVVKDDKRIRTDRSLFGVGCESCHGAGKAHIAAAERGEKNLLMARLADAPERLTVELCGQCHRSPSSEDIHDPFNRDQMPRLQGLALTQSACFRESKGKLSCLTCHQAHGDAVETRATYNSKCVSCHTPTTPEHKACTVDPGGDCVSCHMPAQSVGMPTGLRYRNHWIKVWNPEPAGRPLR